MSLTLRTPDDITRLFTALGDSLTHESGGYGSLSDIDELALSSLDEADTKGIALSLAIALAAGWVAINGYERNQSMGWGLTWAGLGYFFPLSSVIYTALKQN